MSKSKAPPAVWFNHRESEDVPSVGGGAVVSGNMERKVLALPAGTYDAIPGSPNLGGGALINSSAGVGYVANSPDQALTDKPLLLIQKVTSAGPVRCVAIAADSPIAYADLWLGDISGSQQRFRLSPGAPWIGDATLLEQMAVTLPECLPDPWDFVDNTGDTIAQWIKGNVVWDSMSMDPGTALPGGRVEVPMPLRLEIYRGQLPSNAPTLKRAVGVADFGVRIDTAVDANTKYGQLHVPVQGRAQTRVIVMADDPGAGQKTRMRVWGVDPVLKFFNVAQPNNLIQRRGAVTLLDDVLVTPATSQRFVYTQEFAWLKIQLSPDPTTPTVARAAIHVVTRD